MKKNNLSVRPGKNGKPQIFIGDNRKHLLFKNAYINKYSDDRPLNPDEEIILEAIKKIVELSDDGFVSIDETKDIQIEVTDELEIIINGADSNLLEFEINDNGELLVSLNDK